MTFDDFFTAFPFIGEEPPAGDPSAGDPPADSNKQIPQSKMNHLLAEQKRKHNEEKQTLIDELTVLRGQVSETSEEHKSLTSTIERLQEQIQTKEQTAAQRFEDYKKKTEKDLAKANNERDTYRGKLEKTLIKTALVAATSASEMYNAEVSANVMQPWTKLVDKLDGKGQPTGDYDVIVTFDTTNDDGTPLQVVDSPSKVIEFMKKDARYANFFINNKKPGFGLGQGSSTEQNKPPKDTAAYMEWRAKNKKK